MTSYTNSRYIEHVKEYLKDAPWFKGKVLANAGRLPMGQVSRKVKYIQFDKLYALGASIKKADEKEYPASVITDMQSLLRKLKWFNGLIDWTEADYEDLQNGDLDAIEDTAAKIDNVAYQYDYDVETWFVGYGVTFTADPDYDNMWIPWFAAASTSGSTASAPADMQPKVTNIAGTTGTTATVLDMATVLDSTATGMSVDFVTKTFQPIIDGFTQFVDSNTGRRMVDTQDSIRPAANFTVLMAPELIRRLENLHPYDGEKIVMTITIKQQMEAIGINLVPCRLFTASMVEDGVCYFGFVADFARNFKIGEANPMVWEADKEIPDINSKWVKLMNSRLVPFSMPYTDGTNWFKAFFHGSFTYRNDAA